MTRATKLYLNPIEKDPIKQNAAVRQLIEIQSREGLSADMQTPNGVDAQRIFSTTDSGNHAGEIHTAFAVAETAVGSGVNGPLNSDRALTLELFKDGYPSSTAAAGELDALRIAVAQSGPASVSTTDVLRSDALCLQLSMNGADNHGFAASIESVTSHLISTSSVIDKQVRYQAGVIQADGDPTSAGLILIADTGAIDWGLRIQQTSPATFGKAISLNNGSGATLYVAMDGYIRFFPQSSIPAAVKGTMFQKDSDGKFYVCEDGATFRTVVTTT